MTAAVPQRAADRNPLIALTLGDPAGVGPEVVAKALAQPNVRALADLVVVGSPAVLDRAFALVDAGLHATPVADPAEPVAPDAVGVYEEGVDEDRRADPPLADLPYGRVSAAAGAAAVAWATTAARLALDGRVDGVATAPLNKEAAHLAGHAEVGHQEIYQKLTGAEHVMTMLLAPGLRVVHLTTHRSLREACDAVTQESVLAALRLTHDFFAEHGIAQARIAAAALNPHGGEAGLLGSEETTAIGPAVGAARELGIDATGPVPADTVFNRAIDGVFDVVLAMYHDQGHIAIKVHDWSRSVTVNLGLPFLRTSVDHGTAFDIAGRGSADPAGMIEAVRLAAQLARTGSLVSV